MSQWAEQRSFRAVFWFLSLSQCWRQQARHTLVAILCSLWMTQVSNVKAIKW